MTLIQTWLFPFGISMGSDSAISYNTSITEPSGRKRMRILTGCTKTLWIPKIKAGISYWGDGNIDNVTTDVWLSDFIFSRRDQYNNISDFAVLLQDELRELVPKITEPKGSMEYRYGKRGFHLAGFVEHGGGSPFRLSTTYIMDRVRLIQRLTLQLLMQIVIFHLK